MTNNHIDQKAGDHSIQVGKADGDVAIHVQQTTSLWKRWRKQRPWTFYSALILAILLVLLAGTIVVGGKDSGYAFRNHLVTRS